MKCAAFSAGRAVFKTATQPWRCQVSIRSKVATRASDSSEDKAQPPAATTDAPETYSLVSIYQLAESCTFFAGVIMVCFPGLFMAPLLPNVPDLPYFALSSGEAALRIDGALLLTLAAVYNCLADACKKGNFGKSDTYTKLATAGAVTPAAMAVITLLTYGLGDNMRNVALLVLMAGAVTPGIGASYRGFQSSAISVDKAVTTARADAGEVPKMVSSGAWNLEQSWPPLFYQTEALLSLAVGFLLIVLPSSIVESPEPMYTAETLCRRLAGAEAALTFTTANYILTGAARRGRLGATTFRTLNNVMALSNVLVGYALCKLVLESSDTSFLSALPVFIVTGLLPALAFGYLGFFSKSD